MVAVSIGSTVFVVVSVVDVVTTVEVDTGLVAGLERTVDGGVAGIEPPPLEVEPPPFGVEPPSFVASPSTMGSSYLGVGVGLGAGLGAGFGAGFGVGAGVGAG